MAPPGMRSHPMTRKLGLAATTLAASLAAGSASVAIIPIELTPSDVGSGNASIFTVLPNDDRSEECRVGKERVSTCSTRGVRDNQKKNRPHITAGEYGT